MVKLLDERLAQLLEERRRRARARARSVRSFGVGSLLPILVRAYVVDVGGHSWLCSPRPPRQVQPSTPFRVAWRTRCVRVSLAQPTCPCEPSGSGPSAPFGIARRGVRTWVVRAKPCLFTPL